jgi:hypothetical protein
VGRKLIGNYLVTKILPCNQCQYLIHVVWELRPAVGTRTILAHNSLYPVRLAYNPLNRIQYISKCSNMGNTNATNLEDREPTIINSHTQADKLDNG